MKGMNGGCLAFSHRQRQSLSYIIIDSSSFPSFLSLSLPDTSKMAQNGRTPSILLSQTHFLYAFLFLWYPFTIFFFFRFSNSLGFRFALRLPRLCCRCSEEGWRGSLIQSPLFFRVLFQYLFSFSSSFILLRLVNV